MKQKREPRYSAGPEELFFSQRIGAEAEGGTDYYEHDSELQEWWDGPKELTSEERRKLVEMSLCKERADRIEMNRRAIASVTEKMGRPLGQFEYFKAMRCANAGYEACDKKLKTSRAKHDPVPGSGERELYDQLGWVAYMIGWKYRIWQKQEAALVWE